MLGRLLPPQPAMNLDSLSLALSQISYLVDNLTKKNYRASQQEIQHVSLFLALLPTDIDIAVERFEEMKNDCVSR